MISDITHILYENNGRACEQDIELIKFCQVYGQRCSLHKALRGVLGVVFYIRAICVDPALCSCHLFCFTCSVFA